MSGEGILDFAWAATDVYIIPTGGSGGRLTDATGNGPNTIVAASSHIFIDELIGITAPGSVLGPGVYDVVYDTCQDGFFSQNESSLVVKQFFGRLLTFSASSVAAFASKS